MARPSYEGGQPRAKDRLKEAFWTLLAQEDYSRITVKKLSGLAQVNPNTFYYHYASMDDLALDALNDEKLYEIPSIICTELEAPGQGSLREALAYLVVGERWQRIRLFVTSDSAVLHRHFYDTMEQFWLSLIGVRKDQLTEAEQLDLTFILHGAMSIIRLQTEHYDPAFIQSLPDRPLGRGILQTMEQLMRNHRAEDQTGRSG